jgi:hypothetical protein
VGEDLSTNFEIGPQAIANYSRMSYTMWHALGEFIDNSTQSRLNYDGIIKQVLADEGQPLTVDVVYNRPQRQITISDNSIGMTFDKLVAALRIAVPTTDSKGRSRFGMGMKTAACWIGAKWKVITCEWGSGEEWTAEIDVEGIAFRGERVPLTMKQVSPSQHGTTIVISQLHRNIQARTEETIRGYLGSMYQFDIRRGDLRLLYGGTEIPAPDAYDFDTDPDGKIMRMDLPPKSIAGKPITGWIGVLRSGGRKFGGFSLFQNERQIQGFPNAWKPRRIFGGIDDEGANNLVAQRLTGVINLDGFQVSHTKDAVLFEGDEEQDLEDFLSAISDDYRKYANKRRGARQQAWNREKVRDLVEEMRGEFSNPEMQDAIETSLLPPLETILQNGTAQVKTIAEEDKLATFDVTTNLRVVVSLKEVSEYEPHVTIAADATPGTAHVIINRLHPYFVAIPTTEAVSECIRQYIYDAIAEYRVGKLTGKVNPNSVRRFKDDLLRVQAVRIENAAVTTQDGTEADLISDTAS